MTESADQQGLHNHFTTIKCYISAQHITLLCKWLKSYDRQKIINTGAKAPEWMDLTDSLSEYGFGFFLLDNFS